MFKWLGQRFGKRKQKTRQLRERESNIDSLRSLIERAVTNAEQIVASVKMKAQTEAEEEAVRIIDQAKQGADEIRRGAEVVAQKEAKDVLSALNRKEVALPLETSSPTQIEIEPDIASKEKVEQPVQLQEEAKRKTKETRKAKESQKQAKKEAKLTTRESDLEEKVEEPAQLEKAATVSEPAEVITGELPEQSLSEEGPGKGESISTPLKLDSQVLYNGEVELAIAVPVDPVAVSKLYNHLQTTPELKILYVRGSWDRGTTITVTLDRPLPLIGMISKIPGIVVAPELPQKDNLVKGTSSSLLEAKGKRVTRIDLTLKEG